MSPYRRREAGFSLIEVLLVIVILSIIGAGFSRFFLESVKAYAWASEQADLSPGARLAMGRSLREMSMIRDTSSLYSMTNRVLSFRTIAGDSVALSWDGTPGSTLILARNTSSYTLATNVDSVGFSYLTATGGTAVLPADVQRIRVRLRLARGTHKVMNGSTIYVRNG